MTLFFILLLVVTAVSTQDYNNYNRFNGAHHGWRGEHGPTHYIGKHYYYGPLFSRLPRLVAYEVRALVDRGEWTKRTIKQRVDEWVHKQPEKIKEVFNAFDKDARTRVLREKMDHEQYIGNQNNDVRDLDRKIQEQLDNLDLTWYDTCRHINALKHEADPKVLENLGIERRTKCGVNPKVVETENEHEKPPQSFEDFGHKKSSKEEGYNHMQKGNNNEDIYDNNEYGDYNQNYG